MRRLTLLLSIAAPLWLAGCDMLGIESASALAAKREADGRAIGAGCRHAARVGGAVFCAEQARRPGGRLRRLARDERLHAREQARSHAGGAPPPSWRLPKPTAAKARPPAARPQGTSLPPRGRPAPGRGVGRPFVASHGSASPAAASAAACGTVRASVHGVDAMNSAFALPSAARPAVCAGRCVPRRARPAGHHGLGPAGHRDACCRSSRPSRSPVRST